jgi:hypothetical protein
MKYSGGDIFMAGRFPRSQGQGESAAGDNFGASERERIPYATESAWAPVFGSGTLARRSTYGPGMVQLADDIVTDIRRCLEHDGYINKEGSKYTVGTLGGTAAYVLVRNRRTGRLRFGIFTLEPVATQPGEIADEWKCLAFATQNEMPLRPIYKEMKSQVRLHSAA